MENKKVPEMENKVEPEHKCGPIEKVALELLTPCMDDYASKVWNEIWADVITDVCECAGDVEKTGFTNGDVPLAIGRAIVSRLGGDI